MEKQETVVKQPESRWAINPHHLEKNGRSVSTMLRLYLCPKCAVRLKAKGNKNSPEVLMAAIKTCCSHMPEFIHGHQPLLESTFRLFLANGNRPLTLEEIGKQMSGLRGGDPYRTSPDTLLRLLKNDRYYGFQETGADSA